MGEGLFSFVQMKTAGSMSSGLWGAMIDVDYYTENVKNDKWAIQAYVGL